MQDYKNSRLKNYSLMIKLEKILSLRQIIILLLVAECLFSDSISNNTFPHANTISNQSIIETSNQELVLQYLKDIQDNFSNDNWLVPAMEDNSGQTFNNAVTAMAFILTNEKERAERILDFYANRTDTANQNLNYQNFFYNGEARGFFQNIDLNNSYTPFISDRWMGDNAWLLLAYKYYEQEYGFISKPLYNSITVYLKNLLLDFYIDDPSGHGGFVQHGWRWGPRNSSNPVNDYRLHEYDSIGNPIGHEEGNIDAYAAFKLCGEFEKAEKIKEWLDYRMNELAGLPGLPLDLFSWRSLAFCHEGLYYKLLVNVPENDPGFKKQVTFLGREATGFFSFDDAAVQNVWLDGTGHMVCAFYSSGYSDKGNFYSSQLDSFLINRSFGISNSLAIPYTANQTGGYSWVDITKGFSSSCAWYIFAKYGFNPFTFEKNLPTSVIEDESKEINFNLDQNYPNPFNPTTRIKFTVSNVIAGESKQSKLITLKVYDVLGKEVAILVNEEKPAGESEVEFNGINLSGGIYFYQLKSESFVQTKKMVLLK